jgi:hypothetical protein
VIAFASSEAPQDDRRLLVVNFSQSGGAVRGWKSGETVIAAVACVQRSAAMALVASALSPMGF